MHCIFFKKILQLLSVVGILTWTFFYKILEDSTYSIILSYFRSEAVQISCLQLPEIGRAGGPVRMPRTGPLPAPWQHLPVLQVRRCGSCGVRLRMSVPRHVFWPRQWPLHVCLLTRSSQLHPHNHHHPTHHHNHHNPSPSYNFNKKARSSTSKNSLRPSAGC